MIWLLSTVWFHLPPDTKAYSSCNCNWACFPWNSLLGPWEWWPQYVFHSGFCVKMAGFWLKTGVPPRINTVLPNMAKFCSRRGSTLLHSHISPFWLASIKTYPFLLCEWIACQGMTPSKYPLDKIVLASVTLQ